MPTSSTSRRTFLKSMAATALAPYVLTRRARGATAANERINIGLIGLGNIGVQHVGTLANHPEVQLAAVCDVHADLRERALRIVQEAHARRGGAGDASCTPYHEFEHLLARSDIDAVLVATPDHWHAQIAIAACRAGKDVYCEKPLSLTVDEAYAMEAAAHRYGRVFQNGSQQRSEGNFRRACALVRSGRIGSVQTVHVGIGGPSTDKVLPAEPVPAGFDWNRWLGPAPWQPYSSERASGTWGGGGWRAIRDYSGGLMTDWGAHHFDIAQWGLGRDGSGPVEIIPPNEAERGTLTYRYADGVEMYHGGANGVRFTGTEGVVEVNRGYLRTEPESLARAPFGAHAEHLYESPGHIQDWLQCMRSRRRPICDVAIGASSVVVCHLGNIAWWLGRTLRWNPGTRTLLNDPLAARWLARPRRAPWHL
ncbi:MAG: Gfo/Idh/MocA family oxidoreductase [Phycisphaerales bacterium]|nr:Gfo/Idh/MocA family oxidoreductase [Phycisphaerales bacterium]